MCRSSLIRQSIVMESSEDGKADEDEEENDRPKMGDFEEDRMR